MLGYISSGESSFWFKYFASYQIHILLRKMNQWPQSTAFAPAMSTFAQILWSPFQKFLSNDNTTHWEQFTFVLARPSLYSLCLFYRCWSHCALSCFLVCVHGLQSHIWAARGSRGQLSFGSPRHNLPIVYDQLLAWLRNVHTQSNQSNPPCPLKESRPGQLYVLWLFSAVTPIYKVPLSPFASQPSRSHWTCLIAIECFQMWDLA